MTTESQLLAWLKKGGKASVVLVEVGTAEPKYLSNFGYSTLPTDTPANRVYTACVSGGVTFSERLSLDGQATIDYGDIVIDNQDGRFDSWLTEVWRNKPITLLKGGLDWLYSDFYPIFTGVVANLDSSDRTQLVIKLRSKLERLNTPVSDTLLGGSSQNADRLIPWTLGECHNITPLLTNESQLEYQFNGDSAERVIEVRANGVPVSRTDFLGTGKFRLTANPAGATITASVQGDLSYVNTVATLVQRLATQFGTPSERLTNDDLDLVQLGNFNLTHQQPVGVYLSDRANVLQVCQELAASVGAQVTMSRLGKLQLRKVALPGEGTPKVLGPSDYLVHTLRLVSRPDVVAGIRLGYCKNWTVQDTLDTGIPSAHKDLYAQEWKTVTRRDSAVAAAYKLYADPEQKDTLLLRGTDATNEADRLLNLWKVQREVYSMTCWPHMLTLFLGQAVTLKGDRYNLNAGKAGVVVALQSDWLNDRITVEVLV